MYPKFVVLFLFIGFFIFKAAECGMTQEQVDTMARGLRKACTSKVPVELALLDGVQVGNFADDANLKCYMKCALKMMKAIKNGKIDPTMLIAQGNLLPKNSERFVASVKKCSSVSADDECELAFIYVKCIYESDPEVFFFP